VGPWRVLRDEFSDVEFALADLPVGVNAVLAQQGDDAAILVSRRLSSAERLAALAHELTHLRRGGSGWCPDLPVGLRAVVAREEERVDDLAADDLLPLPSLARWCARRADIGPVMPEDVAEEFGVPESLASRQMRRLTG